MGTPLEPGGAYISSGTWSLVGVERTTPLLDDAAARANFTNEIGAFGTVRFLKNVMGLWILESCRREWERDGRGCEYSGADRRRRCARGLRRASCFPTTCASCTRPACWRCCGSASTETGQPAPTIPVHLTRVILDSLALRYASVDRHHRDADRLAHHHDPHRRRRRAERVPEPGDGECDRTRGARRSAEATAGGNVLVQAIACGEVGSLADCPRGARTEREGEALCPGGRGCVGAGEGDVSGDRGGHDLVRRWSARRWADKGSRNAQSPAPNAQRRALVKSRTRRCSPS